MARIYAALLGGIVLAGVAALPGGDARAEGPGRYAVQGTGPDGSSYTGTATLAQPGQGVWSLNWSIGNTTYSGVGVGDGRSLAFGYRSGNGAGVAVYTAQPDGSYSGVWASPGDRTVSTEVLRPQ